METIQKGLESAFNFDYAQNVIDFLQNGGLNAQGQSLMQSVSEAIIPIGLSLAVMFWLMEFLDKSISIQEMSWEMIVKIILRLIIAKYLIQDAGALLELLASIGDSVFSTISSTATAQPTVDLSTALADHKGPLKTLLAMIQLIPFYVVMSLMVAVSNFIMYARLIELVILGAFAPIPVSTLMFDNVRDIGKRYLMYYLAVCLQAAVILLIVVLYSTIFNPGNQQYNDLSDVIQGAVGYMSYTGVLIFCLFNSGSWANKIVGNS